MRKLLLVLLSFLILGSVIAQNDCSNGRYSTPQFDSVVVTSGVRFGSAVQTFDLGGPMYTPYLGTQELFMDIYQPYGDTQENRPMIILAFGGAFVFGTRTDAYMVDLCTRFAKLGYVTASIDYRLTRELATAGLKLDTAIAPKAVLKGEHDMRAAIRYMDSTSINGNTYRIDHNQIFVGGVSAGAFCALHAAYLDKDYEIPEELKAYAYENGGIEGLSGALGYSSKVAGVISFSGALGQATWLEEGDVPIVSTHGTADAVVPYGSDSVTILLINYPVDGSSVIHQHADEVGVKNAFYTYYGAGHAMEATDEAYRDTGFAFARDFMTELVCSSTSGIQTVDGGKSLRIFPNPAQDAFTIDGLTGSSKLRLFNSIGALVNTYETTRGSLQIKVDDLPKGLYSLEISGSGTVVSKIVSIN